MERGWRYSMAPFLIIHFIPGLISWSVKKQTMSIHTASERQCHNVCALVYPYDLILTFILLRQRVFILKLVFSPIYKGAWIFSDWPEVFADYRTAHPVHYKGEKIKIWLWKFFKQCICGEPAISLHFHHVPLVQWTTCLHPITKGPGFKSPGGYLCETRILQVAISRYTFLHFFQDFRHIIYHISLSIRGIWTISTAMSSWDMRLTWKTLFWTFSLRVHCKNLKKLKLQYI